MSEHAIEAMEKAVDVALADPANIVSRLTKVASEYAGSTGVSPGYAAWIVADTVKKAASEHAEAAVRAKAEALAAAERAAAAKEQLKESAMAKEATREDINNLMHKRAEELRADGETPQQAFAKYMETPEGLNWYRAYKRLPAAEYTAPIAKLSNAQETLAAKVAEIRKADPRLTPQQAAAKAYDSTPGLLRKLMVEARGGDAPEAA